MRRATWNRMQDVRIARATSIRLKQGATIATGSESGVV